MKQWTFSTRYVDSDEADERWIHVLEYRFDPRFSYGVEYNPGNGSTSLFRIIWTLQEETARKPMVALSTSETRVGSVAGGHVNLSFAKTVPKSPLGVYASVHYAVDRGFEFPHGASWQLNKDFSLMAMQDGERWSALLNFVQRDYWISVGTLGFESPMISFGWGIGEVRRQDTRQ